MKPQTRFARRTLPLALLIALGCDGPAELASAAPDPVRTAPAPAPTWARDAVDRIDLARTHLTKQAWIAAGLPANHPALDGPTEYVRSS